MIVNLDRCEVKMMNWGTKCFREKHLSKTKVWPYRECLPNYGSHKCVVNSSSTGYKKCLLVACNKIDSSKIVKIM